VPASLPQPQA